MKWAIVIMSGVGLALIVYAILRPRWETFTEQHAEGEIDEKTRTELRDFFSLKSRHNGEYNPDKTEIFQQLIVLPPGGVEFVSHDDYPTDPLLLPVSEERLPTPGELEAEGLATQNTWKIEWCESVADQLQREFEEWRDRERLEWDHMMERFLQDMDRIRDHRSILEVG